MDAAELVEQLRPHLAGALVATDFDGTLAPLVLDPDSSRPGEGAVEELAPLAGRGAQRAGVPGRGPATVARLGGLPAVPGIVVAGGYGIETWQAGRLTSPEPPPAI